METTKKVYVAGDLIRKIKHSSCQISADAVLENLSILRGKFHRCNSRQYGLELLYFYKIALFAFSEARENIVSSEIRRLFGFDSKYFIECPDCPNCLVNLKFFDRKEKVSKQVYAICFEIIEELIKKALKFRRRKCKIL